MHRVTTEDNGRESAADSSMEITEATGAEGNKIMTAECPKKAAFMKKIIDMVTHAEKVFSLGVGYRIISQKMSRSVTCAGYDLGTLLAEMDAAGLIFLYTDENYSRLVMTQEMREYYKLGIIGEETEETRNFIRAKWGRKGRGRTQ